MPFRPSFDASPTMVRLARLQVCSYFCIGFLNHRLTLLLYNMKLDSINGKGSGKSGAKVYYVNHGVQIEREYTSEVSNPNTPAQVSQRSRFKLASQISAIFEPVIAIPRKGMQSPRNQFTKLNMGFFYGSDEDAQVTLDALQLTKGGVVLPPVALQRGQTTDFSMSLADSVESTISRVIYSVFKITSEGSVQLVDSIVVNDPGENRTFPHTMTFPASVQFTTFYVYAYGMRDRNNKAKAVFSNYQAVVGFDLVRLIAQRSLDPNNYALTKTKCSVLFSGQNSNIVPEQNKVLIYVNKVGKGSVVVSDNNNEVDMSGVNYAEVGLAHTIKLQANPETTSGEIWEFEGWYNNGEQIKFSASNPYTFTITEQREIVAKFIPRGLE